MDSKPVVIIGAGFSGMIALKICLENDLNVICLEKIDSIGGLWRFRDGDYDGIASVTQNTYINTSKEMSAMSDFVPSQTSANFMHHSDILSYLEDYVEHFKLLSHVRFNHEVLKVSKADDFEETGEWIICVSTKEGENTTITAKGVLVCIGHHVYPNVPEFPGQSEFCGKVLHTHSYKHYHDFEGKRVVVVGVGNSGMDASVELSFVASKVYLSTRRGTWVLPRVGENGLPIDFSMTRWSAFMQKHFRNHFLNNMEGQLNHTFDHELYNLKPKHRYDGQHPTVSDALPSRIMTGAVIVKGDVKRLTKDGVIFKGEDDAEYKIDAIITATGYNIRFPFLDDIMKTDKNQVELYRRLIPPRLTHPTLAVIGLIQPIGPIFPPMEIQCRWMAKVFKKEIVLPPENERVREVEQFTKNLRARFVGTQRHTIQVDLVPYMDELANDIGCKPNLAKLFFADHQLFKKLMFGPLFPYQYRLFGPHSWSGAREAVMNAHDRMVATFKTRFEEDN